MRAIVSAAGRFLIAAGILLSLVWASPLYDILGCAVAYVASKVLSAVWGLPVDWLLTPGSTVGLGIGRDGAYFRADVATLPMVRNVPVFLASILTFGGWRSPRIWFISAIGVMAVIFLDGVVLVAATWPTLAVVSGIAPSTAYQVIEITRMNFGTGGLMVAPVFLGAVLAWTTETRPSAPLPPASSRPR